MTRSPVHGLRPLLLATALAFGTLPTMTAHAQSSTQASPDGTLLSVSALGEVSQAPDIARLSTGVVTQAADANAAMRANAEQMSRVVAALKGAGIAERDIQTSGVNLYPQYRHDDGSAPTITGYQASNTVNVTVRDLGKLGPVMDTLVDAGANQVNGPSFDIDDKTAALDEARRKAVEQARARAAMYAKTLGLRVRRIVSISEGGDIARPMPMMAMARAEKSSFDTPISPGENTLSVNLDIVFELGN
ncbi:SIMPL domain-containing protein [Marilutibacter spongiae]|uniref:SIMPL domain-containing protein n=1 Tax=Marilutibacter spongiae TaxID=2025720 RepID=A0A7W3Y613_9GAMM|nr:SIMPL domain-containing protein [Lysobacter spongiae]MBB1060988.1 SIMPL domain-containing protein [Lysobacter spongiae]